MLLGKGNGDFKAVKRFNATDGSNYSVAAGRFNQDRDLDLAVPDYDLNYVAILLAR